MLIDMKRIHNTSLPKACSNKVIDVLNATKEVRKDSKDSKTELCVAL